MSSTLGAALADAVPTPAVAAAAAVRGRNAALTSRTSAAADVAASP
jgi:hypothetical protein